MDVEHGLVRGGAVVLEDVVGARAGGGEHGAGDARQHAADRGGGVIGQGVEGRGRFLGDHQGVAARQWIDVEERKDGIVLVDAVARDLPAHDLGEHGLGHAARVARRLGEVTRGLAEFAPRERHGSKR